MSWPASWRLRLRPLLTCCRSTGSPKRKRTQAPFPPMSRKRCAGICTAWQTPRLLPKQPQRRRKKPRNRRRKPHACGPHLPRWPRRKHRLQLQHPRLLLLQQHLRRRLLRQVSLRRPRQLLRRRRRCVHPWPHLPQLSLRRQPLRLLPLRLRHQRRFVLQRRQSARLLQQHLRLRDPPLRGRLKTAAHNLRP